MSFVACLAGSYSHYDNGVVTQVPVIHFTAAKPPLLICIKRGLTEGAFEENLASLQLTEGVHFVYFSM